MSEIRSDIHGPGHHHVHQTGQISGTQISQIMTPAGLIDILESSHGKKGNKAVEAVSPELMQALFMMWFTGGNQPIFIQDLKGSAGGVQAISDKPINAELFSLQMQNKLSEICIGMLEAWSKSIHEEAVALKRKMKQEALERYNEKHGNAGFNAWREQLSPEQRRQVDEFSKIERQLKIDQGVQHGLSDYLMMIKTSTDPTVSQDLPFIAAALIIGGSLRNEYVGIVDTVSTSQILITPIKEANDSVFVKMAPLQAPILGYISALVLTGASYHALAQTLPLGAADKKILDHKFAESYASKILNTIDGPGLKTIAWGLISSGIEPNAPLSEERKTQLFQAVKVALLSSALALLYKTESSVSKNGKVIGGGITSEEFLSMVNGDERLLDTPLKSQLAQGIRVLLEGLPDKDVILASLGNFIDQHKDSSKLLNIDQLFANIILDKGPNPKVVGA